MKAEMKADANGTEHRLKSAARYLRSDLQSRLSDRLETTTVRSEIMKMIIDLYL